MASKSVIKLKKFDQVVHLNWEELQKLWKEMRRCETKYQHSIDMFERHCDLTPPRRSILLSWLSEVCAAYKLHRETYYLAVELLDRFLLSTPDIDTSHLQLAGVTALMLASKMEEIHPPKGEQFAYITDGACDWKQVQAFETFMLEKLNWVLVVPSLNTWLQMYLQMATSQCKQEMCTAPNSSDVSTNSTDLDTSSCLGISSLVEHTRSMELSTIENVCFDSNEKSNCYKWEGVENYSFYWEEDEESSSTISEKHCSVLKLYEEEEKETKQREDKAETETNESGRIDVCGKHTKDIVGNDGKHSDQEQHDISDEMPKDQNIFEPQYSPEDYIKASQLLDLVVLDSNSLRFKYSTLAAAVLFYSVSCDDICEVTDLSWGELEPCVQWMKIHKTVLDSWPATLCLETMTESEVRSETCSQVDVEVCGGDSEDGEELNCTVQTLVVTQSMWQEAALCSDNYFSSTYSTVLSHEPSPPVPAFITPPHLRKQSRLEDCYRS